MCLRTDKEQLADVELQPSRKKIKRKVYQQACNVLQIHTDPSTPITVASGLTLVGRVGWLANGKQFHCVPPHLISASNTTSSAQNAAHVQ